MRNLLIALLLLTTVFSSCTKEDNIPYNVDPDFEYFVQKFIHEGSEFGYFFDFKNDGLILRYADGEKQETITTNADSRYVNDVPEIIIFKSRWDMFSWNQKECLVFHMLGLKVLKRVSTTDTLPNGDAKSIMNNPSDLRLWDGESGFKREYYIQELFEPTTPIPDWAEGWGESHQENSDDGG